MDWTADVTSKTVGSLTASTTYHFVVAVKDAAGNESLYPSISVTTAAPDMVAPAAGTGLAFSAVTATGLTVSWGAGTDDLSASENLEYRLVGAMATTSIDDATKIAAITGADVLMDWTAGVTSKALTGNSAGDNYAYAVAVRDGAGQAAAYAPSVRVNGRMIFATATESTGAMGGLSGADAYCASHAPANVDKSVTLRAMLGKTGERVACSTANCGGGPSENLNWVLQPTTAYYNTSGTLVGTTDANAIFTFPLNAAIATATPTNEVWTGIETNWVTSANTCNGWTGAGGYAGNHGWTTQTDSGMLRVTANACSYDMRVYCVE